MNDLTDEVIVRILSRRPDGRWGSPTADEYALAAEVQRRRAEDRWIPVGERLPEGECTEVLVVYEHGVTVGHYHPAKRGSYWRAADDDTAIAVTHWRAKPAPPKEGE